MDLRSALRAVVPWLGLCVFAVLARAQESAAHDPARLGGAGSVLDDGPDAFGHPVAVLSALERRAFMVGNALFRTNWVSAPASAEGMDGLGPLFNARSCSSCHLKDGRGRPPPPGDEAVADVTGLLVRLHSPDYGTQLQDHAVQGVRPEGKLRIREEILRGRYGDGTAWELAAPRYEIVDAAYGPLADEPAPGARVAPQMIGLGLLEIVPEEVLLARADPEDRDGDGISGRARWVGSEGARRLGRFGWKASQPTVRAQAAAAFANDMGITSSLFPADDVTVQQRALLGDRTSSEAPELSDHKLDRIALYCAALAVPAQRDGAAPDVRRGELLFLSAGCTACHAPELQTGGDGAIEGLRHERIRPYTDLLLHDLGDGLADGVDDGDAGRAEWRTPPLWGIGLFEVVNGHHRYLHDGRARSLEEAILWHGGEAVKAAAAFRALDAADRARLIRFLQSL